MYIRSLDLVAPSPKDEISSLFSSDWTIPVAALLVVGTIILLIIHNIRNK